MRHGDEWDGSSSQDDTTQAAAFSLFVLFFIIFDIYIFLLSASGPGCLNNIISDSSSVSLFLYSIAWICWQTAFFFPCRPSGLGQFLVGRPCPPPKTCPYRMTLQPSGCYRSERFSFFHFYFSSVACFFPHPPASLLFSAKRRERRRGGGVEGRPDGGDARLRRDESRANDRAA